MKTIGVVSPSSAVDESDLTESVDFWRQRGFEVKLAPHLYEKHRFLAGTDESRAADLTAMFVDDGIDFIFAAGGGYGSARLLNRLDYDLISRHKKPFVGLSDTTAVQLALYAKAGVPCYTGYLMKPRHGRVMFPYTDLSLDDCLNGRDQTVSGLETDFSGKIEGILIGGCLSLVVGLPGTPYMPDMTGAILVLEDVGEEPYAVDRMLTRLDNAGVFDKAAAVVFGVFTDCKAEDPTDGTVGDVLNEWKNRLKIPVFTGFPYGHQAGSIVFPIGGKAVVSANEIRIRGRYG